MTASEEVDAMATGRSRPLKRVILARTYGSSQASIAKFISAADETVTVKAYKDPKFALLKRQVDAPVQASSPLESSETQTNWERAINSSSQYVSTDFLRPDSLSEGLVQSLAEFLRKPEASQAMEIALQSNETIDVYTNALTGSDNNDDDLAANSFREVRSFHDVAYTKGKIVQHTEWVTGSSRSQISCSYVSSASFINRIDECGQPSVSHILFWNFQDSLSPKLIFSSPWEVPIFRFWPPRHPRYLLGGLGNGQLAIWKIPSASDGGIVPPLLFSEIAASHKRPVTSLFLLPENFAVNSNGENVKLENSRKVEEGEEVEEGGWRFAMTTSGDGQIFFWDISAALDSGLADFRPVFLMGCLIRQDSQRELGCVEVLHAPEIGPTSFLASTEEGEYLVGEWTALMEVVDDRRPEYIKMLSSSVTRNFRPTLAFQRSPFFPNILLGVTDWCAVLWRAGLAAPLLVTPAPASYYTCGAWSPHRPGVFFLGRVDGQLETWDLLEQSNKPSNANPVSAVALASIAFTTPGQFESAELKDLVAIGDEQGHLRLLQVPAPLQRSTQKEFEFITTLFSAEEKRQSYLKQRAENLAAKRTAELIAAQKAAVEEEMKRDRGSGGQGGSAPVVPEDLEISSLEKEFQGLRTDFSANLKK